MSILFIDDDPDDYDLFCEAIVSFNQKTECLQAFNGGEAIRLLSNTRVVLPDYIFLDVNMPGMSGEECMVKIKSNSRLKDIPIIIYTTTSDFAEQQAFMKLGAAAFIMKPAMFHELVDVLKELLTSE